MELAKRIELSIVMAAAVVALALAAFTTPARAGAYWCRVRDDNDRCIERVPRHRNHCPAGSVRIWLYFRGQRVPACMWLDAPVHTAGGE